MTTAKRRVEEKTRAERLQGRQGTARMTGRPRKPEWQTQALSSSFALMTVARGIAATGRGVEKSSSRRGAIEQKI